MGNIYTQLSLQERTMTQTQLERGLTPAAIALGLNRSASTLSRELRRNGWTRPTTRRGPGRPPLAGGYRAAAAHTRAQASTVTPRVVRRLRLGTALWDQVTRYLKAGYSPEQIAGTLADVHPARPSLQVSHETIYTSHLCHAPWRLVDGRDRVAALRPCQTASPSARRRPAGTDS